MKRTILDAFNDQNSIIDPAFKAKLRKQLLATQNKPVKRRRKLWLVPAGGVAIAAVLLAFGVNLQRPGQGSSPLRPASVSAAEIINQTDKATNYGTLDNYYTYFRSEQVTTYGSDAKVCDAGNYIGDDTDETYLTTAYRAKDGVEEAVYEKQFRPDGSIISSQSAYDNSSKEIYEGKAFLDASGYFSLKSYFSATDLSNVRTNFLSDKNGNKIDPDSVIPKTSYQGHDAYMIYAISNPASQDSQLRCWPAGSNRNPKLETGTYLPPVYEQRINRYIVEASSYRLLRQTSYRGTAVDDKKLLTDDQHSIVYKQYSAQQALAAMSTDGFDKATAASSYYGHD